TIIKTPQNNENDESDDESDDDSKKKKSKKQNKTQPKVKFDTVKFKLSYKINEKDKDTPINTTKIVKVVDGKKTVIDPKPATIDAVSKHVTFRSTVRLIFSINKIWANKTVAAGATTIPYGVGLKALVIEYTPSPNRAINNDDIDFMSEEEEEEENVKSTKKTTKKTAKLDSDDEGDDDDEVPVTKSTKKKASKEESDDDDEEVSVSKSTKKKSKKVESDDDEDNDDDDDIEV